MTAFIIAFIVLGIIIIALGLFIAYILDVIGDMREEMASLTLRVNNLMECVHEFNQKLKDYEKSK